MKKEIASLIELDRQRTLLAHIDALLGWDQETYLPKSAVDERAEQIALIQGLVHEKAVEPRVGQLLSALEKHPDLEPLEKAYLRVIRREYDKETKLPPDFVMELARQTSLAQAAWADARRTNDFALFAPHLEKVIELNKRLANYINPHGRPYDVLLDLYEEGSTEAGIAAIFAQMKADTLKILSKIQSRPQVDDSFLHRPVSADRQARISLYLMDAVGFEKDKGRLDTVAHPFTTTLGKSDIRITTRYIEDFLASSMFSTIHESGHALYEMGIDPDPEYSGTRLAEPVSMAIHESQSRLWENMIGRSKAFWERHYAKIQEMAGTLDDVDLDSFVLAINKVEPSLIRTEADEVTYGLHIILRFELESSIMADKLAVKDIPEAWNAKTKELFGLDVPNNSSGCLQDIHWSMGSFGYFPSYALGNLYAAQFWHQMHKDIPDLEAQLTAGKTSVPLAWLRKNVHCHGSFYKPDELVKKATGEGLSPRYFAEYLDNKYAAVYGY